MKIQPILNLLRTSCIAATVLLCSIHAQGQGLVGYWKFDEGKTRNTADSSGNGNSGSLQGSGGPTWITGVLSNALRFDGVDEYVNVPNSPVFGITGDITIAAWIRREALLSYDGIVAKTDGAAVWDYDFYFSEGDNRLRLWSDVGSPTPVLSSREVADTNWHHVAVTRSGADVTFYIDGFEAGTTTMSGAFANNSVPVRIGTDGPNYDPSSMFKGSIDDVRIYDRALSATEIQALNVTGTGPEIVVVGNGTSLITGDTTPSFAEGTDFGIVDVNGGSAVRTYTIYNFGTVNLTVGAVTISGPNTADFTAIAVPVSPVASGGSTTLSIRFDPSAAGTRNATVSFGTSDSDENPFTFAIRGAGQSSTILPGFLKREVYQNISGVLVSDLTASPKYPNFPDASELIAGFEAPVDVGSAYGQRISGFITPWETTNYIFFISSDDQGELWLSSDESPTNKVLIAWEPEWNASRDWMGTVRRTLGAPENRSAPIHLEAGRRYYVEALQKEGDGGDNVGVTAIREGDPLPESGSAPLQGAFIGTFSVPATNTVAFTVQPSNTVVVAGNTATFSALASSSSTPIVYQWQRNEVNIFKANGPIYVTPAVSGADNLSRYRCIAYISGGASATSSVAVLTVEGDVFAPVVVRVHALADPTTDDTTQVTVVFDELLDEASATEPFNYQIDGAIVSAASLLPNLKTVVLTVSTPLAAGFHTVTIENVVDRSPAHNQITSVTKQFHTTHLVAHYAFDNSNNPGEDSAGGNDGILVGGPTPVAGQIRSALSFDNVDDYVVVSNSPTFGVTADITLAAWVKRENLSQYAAILAKTDGANFWDFDWYFDDGSSRLTFYSDSTTPTSVTSTAEVLDTEWHHVAVTRNGDTITFYINGVDAGSAAMSGGFGNNPVSIRIGTDGPAWSSGSMFGGSIDDVRIYNRALSAAEIQMLVVRPRLSIAHGANSVVLSWPTAATDFILESAASISAASWTTVTDVPNVSGDQNTLSFTIGAGNRFYRLKE
jgi:hypothetical protein